MKLSFEFDDFKFPISVFNFLSLSRLRTRRLNTPEFYYLRSKIFIDPSDYSTIRFLDISGSSDISSEIFKANKFYFIRILRAWADDVVHYTDPFLCQYRRIDRFRDLLTYPHH